MAYTTAQVRIIEGIRMRSLNVAALVAAALGLLAGCGAKAPDKAAIEAMIRAHSAAWFDAYNAGDVDKIVAGYADDAVLMPPEAPAAVGREAMKQYLATDIAASKAAGVTIALDADTIGFSGDLAWHSGTFHATGSAGTTVGTGKFLEVWHQDKGNWLIIRDTWNTDAPAVAAAPPPAAAPKAPAHKAAPKKKHKKK
jgi:ketosteroid isomerase-like protein